MNEARSAAADKIAARVRDLRYGTKLSRKKLAERADMDVSHLARIESGQGNPTVETLIQLATALDVTVEHFVEGLTAADLPSNVKPYSEADFRRALRGEAQASQK
ncbi:helix-turn-helix transcriptional regulator [Microbacterium sp. KR10-403]|uniref:helix-turn-helix domain-containing protein n=1 Tax=Microbacterium sp. KR10-403 TaxID=3158581 RepID=UPI0032E41712